jgi:phosphodiesterase/alkaline phosphatase D-like protein
MRFILVTAAALAVFVLTGPVASGGSDAAPAKPRVRYLFATVGAEPTSLLFGAAVDTGGTATTYYVEYGPTPALGTRTPTETLVATPNSASGNPTIAEVRVTAKEVAPATRFHYRVVLANASGTLPSARRTVQSGGRSPRIAGVFTRDARTPTNLVVGGTIDTGGLDTTVHVEYGQSPRRSSAKYMVRGVPSPGSFAPTKHVVRIPLTKLAPGKHYIARIVAVNAAGQTSFTDDVVAGKRRSGVALPVVEAGAKPTTVIIRTVVDTGGLATSYHVEYGTRPSYGRRTATQKLPALPGKNWNKTSKEIQVTLKDLNPVTTYFYRLVATNEAGTDFSGRSFVTGGSKPSISYVIAGSGSGSRSLSFGAGIDTGGLPTTYYMEYGTDLSYGSRTSGRTLPALPRPSSFRSTADDARSEEIAIGAAGTYHYRTVATNAAGTSYSQDRTVELK